MPHSAESTTNAENPATLISPSGCKFDAAIQDFISTADAIGAPRPASEELARMVYQVVGFTRELIPGKLTFETCVDPEIRDDLCLQFQVDAAGTVEEILTLEDAWLRRVISLAPRWPALFRLSINAR